MNFDLALKEWLNNMPVQLEEIPGLIDSVSSFVQKHVATKEKEVAEAPAEAVAPVEAPIEEPVAEPIEGDFAEEEAIEGEEGDLNQSILEQALAG